MEQGIRSELAVMPDILRPATADHPEVLGEGKADLIAVTLKREAVAEADLRSRVLTVEYRQRIPVLEMQWVILNLFR